MTGSGGQPIDIGALIGRGPWSLFQKSVLGLTVFAIILDGFDNQVIGFAMPALLKEWGVNRLAMAPVLTASLIGMTLGSATAGLLGDRLGCRRLLIGCVLLFATTTIFAAITNGIAALTVLRLLAGLGLGGAMPNAAALISEFTPARYRILAVSFAAVCVPLGGVIGGMVAAVILPALGWRALFLIGGGAPLLFAFLLFAFLPESPRFLLRSGDPGKRLPRLVASIGHPAPAEGIVFLDTEEGEAQDGISRASLFGADYRADTLALCAAFFSCLLATYSVFNWLPTLMNDAGYRLADASYGLAMYNVGGVLAALLGGWASGPLGSKRPLLALSVGGILVAALLAGLGLRPGEHSAVTFIALLVLGASSAGAQSLLTALAAGVYPTRMRATGVGTAIGIGRLGAVTGSIVGAVLLARGGGMAFFAMQAIAMAAAAIAILIVKRHALAAME